ncbi:cytochrome c oxidase subunit VIb [Heterostelium album PN500]|uniref:Cytochrome c oxidase subunit VIb n=1 Tax=Heterostelium pallidum (strain ATCC 26659 / Pp 5 / PN500) TaxID=670386 RepID=D3AY77_HETP5|nr:cytochrome c oxidase subunit VIb [Heterostelium album PN500]EFA85904.1 cytochrome c oxidase subunit VIb [Heterostelium album PN500]|eukprot:XP_020438010.1 cytochrome c oxidase subunit VIb [Heterostelium album PN500]
MNERSRRREEEMSQQQQQQQQRATGGVPVDLSAMTPEERTKYSLLRAPDYHGTDDKVLSTSRSQCWSARDKYFACLDANNENQSICKQFYDEFSSSCLSSWKEYFIKKRLIEKQKSEMLDSSTKQ